MLSKPSPAAQLGRCLEICEGRGAATVALCTTAGVNRQANMSENGSGTPSRSPSIADSTNDSRWRNHGGGRCHSAQAACCFVSCCIQHTPNVEESASGGSRWTVCLAGKASPSSGKCHLRPLHRVCAAVKPGACMTLHTHVLSHACTAQGCVCAAYCCMHAFAELACC